MANRLGALGRLALRYRYLTTWVTRLQVSFRHENLQLLGGGVLHSLALFSVLHDSQCSTIYCVEPDVHCLVFTVRATSPLVIQRASCATLLVSDMLQPVCCVIRARLRTAACR